MGLFSNKELAALQGELDRTKAENEKTARTLAENGRKVEKIQSRLDEVLAEKANLDLEVGALKLERDRAKEEQAKAEQMGRWLEERLKKASAEVQTAKARPEPVVVTQDTGIEEELDSVKAENAGLRTEIAALRDAAAKAANERRHAPVREVSDSTNELAVLRGDIQSLRRRLAETEERRQLAIRKAEHNRRAYLVTQLQLDMAEDRVYLLLHGKPRPVLATGPDGEPLRGHVRIEAEDVPEAEEGLMDPVDTPENPSESSVEEAASLSADMGSPAPSAIAQPTADQDSEPAHATEEGQA